MVRLKSKLFHASEINEIVKLHYSRIEVSLQYEIVDDYPVGVKISLPNLSSSDAK